MSFLKIGSIRQKPRNGDIFMIHIMDIGFLYGRVVSTDTVDSRFGRAWDDSTLIYIYSHINDTVLPCPEELSLNKLLVPPLIVNGALWSGGFAKKIEQRLSNNGEVMAQHCFSDEPVSERCYDEFGNELTTIISPCGELMVTTLYGIEESVRKALGLPIDDFD